jgi:hypothetical protein
MPLPPGVTSANYQVSFEAVNPLYFDAISVGPYVLGSPSPSGTLSTIPVNGLQLGATQNLTFNAANSAGGPILNPFPRPQPVRILPPDPIQGPIQKPIQGPIREPLPTPEPVREPLEEAYAEAQSILKAAKISAASQAVVSDGLGTEAQPEPLPATGAWTGRLAQVGQDDWLTVPVRGNRIFTVVAQALDETGTPSAVKAMPAIGVWDGFAPAGSAAAGFAPAENGLAAGETWLQVGTSANEVVRIGIADQRGDGRPDYLAAGATIQWPVQALVINGTQPAGGYQVVWQSASGIAAGAASTSNSAGIASSTLTVGPLAEGQTASSTACVSGTSVCVIFQAFGSRSEYATLVAVSGTSQSMAVTTSPTPVVVRVFDMDGNPMAGGTVTVNQSLYAWTPACPPHGRCDQPQLLASQATTAISALDGSVSIAPLTLSGVPTNLKGIAATGNAGSLTFGVEQHP